MTKRIALIGLLLVITYSSVGVGPAQAEPSAVGGFTGCVNPTNQTDMPTAECLALVALYDGTTGASWTTDTDWKATDTPCSWFGVTCTSNHVTTLFLNSNNLVGTIPTALGDLTSLQHLRLQVNSLSGGIPTELGNLSNLVALWLQSNSLSGSIPAALGNLSSLSHLYLNSNSLSGAIPVELGNLSNLVQLWLSSNGLTGSIPIELGNLSKLKLLYLYNNSLTGTIPVELGNLSNLNSLELHNNGLTGSIPVELGNLSNVLFLYLYSNSLSGSIPTQLGNLSNMTRLYLNQNNLTGGIPVELGNLSNLEHLYLYGNSLNGAIPVELGNLSNLTQLYINHNGFTGNIPKQLGNLANLKQLYMQSNSLSGSIPAKLGNLTNLTGLRLSSNSLSGIVPTKLGNLTNLTALEIEGNTGLSGWLPSSLTNLASLSKFTFQSTSLCERPDGAFQAWLGGITILDSTNVTCTEIFTDGFESGSFSAWNAANTGGGDLKVCTKAALNGTYGMCVKNKTNNTKFVTDSGMSETWLSAQFNFDPNGLKLQNKKKVRILQAKDGSTATHWLELRKKNGKFQLRAMEKLDGSGKVKTGWQKISNKVHLIEVEWSAATGAGSNDGYLSLYIDDRLKQSKRDLDTDTYIVDSLKLGFTNSPSSFSVSGTFFIDDFVSSDDGYIGK